MQFWYVGWATHMQVFGKLDKSKVFNRILQPTGKENMYISVYAAPKQPLQNKVVEPFICFTL